MFRFILYDLWPVLLVVGALFLWRWYGQKRKGKGLKPLLRSDMSYIMITLVALIAVILCFAMIIFFGHDTKPEDRYQPAHIKDGKFYPDSWK